MHKNTKISPPGFTIVELLIVIVVIGILAAITIVSYGQIRKSAVNSVIQSTLETTAKKFAVEKQLSGSYPTTAFPADITAPIGTGLALTETGSNEEFCINGTAQNYSDVQWHVDQNLTVATGLCAGAVVNESIIGDYYVSDEPITFVIPPKEKTVQGTGEFALTVYVPEAWNQITISWTQPASTASSSTYEIQTRNSSSGTWYYRYRSDGSGAMTSANYGYSTRSWGIPYSTTSLTWTSQLPASAGADYEYRIRYKTSGGVFGEWDTVALGNPVQSVADAPSLVTGFAVTHANDWSTITLGWDQLPGFAIDMSELSYEIQSRTSSTATWYYHDRADGSSDYTTANYGYNTRTWAIPYDTTSLTWTSKIPPSSGSHYEYRIRYYLQGQINTFSEWTEISLDR